MLSRFDFLLFGTARPFVCFFVVEGLFFPIGETRFS